MKRHLQGRTGALQRCGRQRHHGVAALGGKGLHRRPGGLRCLRAGVDAGQPIAADGAHVHAFDLPVVQLQAGGDDQEVVADALATGRDHGVAAGLETGHHVLDPFQTRGVEVRIVVTDLLDRPDTGGHQRVAGLVVVLFLGVDQGDAGTVQQLVEPVGHRDATQAAARDHDVGTGLERGAGRRRRAGGRQQRGRGNGLQPAAARLAVRVGCHAVSSLGAGSRARFSAGS
jgi:hypothetical protein